MNNKIREILDNCLDGIESDRMYQVKNRAVRAIEGFINQLPNTKTASQFEWEIKCFKGYESRLKKSIIEQQNEIDFLKNANTDLKARNAVCFELEKENKQLKEEIEKANKTCYELISEIETLKVDSIRFIDKISSCNKELTENNKLYENENNSLKQSIQNTHDHNKELKAKNQELEVQLKSVSNSSMLDVKIYKSQIEELSKLVTDQGAMLDVKQFQIDSLNQMTMFRKIKFLLEGGKL